MAALDARTPDDGGRPLGETIAARSDDGQEKVDSEETLDWVRSAVDHLAAPQRQLVKLIYHEGLKYREVASLLGIPLGTVKSRMHAAIVAIAREPRRSMAHSPR
jgi:RNA polymerase sigma-70 factor (ECF subfamily)